MTRKPFTQTEYNTLLSIVGRCESSRICSLTDAIGDFFGGIALGYLDLLGVSESLRTNEDYQTLLVDTCNITRQQITEMFENVSNVDAKYAKNTSQHQTETYKPVMSYLSALSAAIDPSSKLIGISALTLAAQSLPKVSGAFLGSNESKKYFGGDQGAEIINWVKYAAIVRKYFPGYTDEQVKEVLSNLNNSGCGYTALINALFVKYEGMEDEFYKVFGFPMYDEDGNPNFGEILVDFYCKETGGIGEGTDANSRKVLWEDYMEAHGVDCTVSVRDDVSDISIDSYREIVKDGGTVIIGIRPVRLYDEEGNLVFDTSISGHAMTVVGVTDDGKYIVSSWGKKYYVNPKDFENISEEDGHFTYNIVYWTKKIRVTHDVHLA